MAIDPFTEAENLPLQLLAKASAALVAVQLLATLDFPALIGFHNAARESRPFTTKAAGTGITTFSGFDRASFRRRSEFTDREK